jgi:hypothetical protein
MFTMLPRPTGSMARNCARRHRKTPVRSTARTDCQASRG